MVRDLVLSAIVSASQLESIFTQLGATIPFVETDIVLDKEEDFIWQEGWPQRSGEVDVF
jgi:hypothetical protein